jgi:tRNA A37 threonylcarbamoyladenosine dehydratase
MTGISTPGLSMDAADVQRRFSGLERLYGVTGAARIRAAHVVVVGLGGVGSWAAEALARSGVGRLTLIDLDHVAESNINRQVHAIDSTVGQAKVQAMRERIAQIHPGCQVNCIEEFVEPGNWPQLLEDAKPASSLQPQCVPASALIDACDQVQAKTALSAWAMRQRVGFISVGAAGGKRLAHQVDIDDLARVTHDPLLAQLRYRLRKHHRAPRDGKKIGVPCVFSREPVSAPDASCDLGGGDGSLNCHGYGSVVSVTASFGLCAAGWVLDFLARANGMTTD